MPTRRTVLSRTGARFLRHVESHFDDVDTTQYPFNVPAFSKGLDIAFDAKVTFLVGENGSGKSTLLEAIAECCGFSPEGGSRDHNRAAFEERSAFAQALRLSWQPKVVEGFFMRAESFYNLATYLDQVSDMRIESVVHVREIQRDFRAFWQINRLVDFNAPAFNSGLNVHARRVASSSATNKLPAGTAFLLRQLDATTRIHFCDQRHANAILVARGSAADAGERARVFIPAVAIAAT